MSGFDLFIFIGFIWVIAWILRNVLKGGSDLLEQGRRTMEDLAESMRDAEVRTPPGPRSTPRVSRPATRSNRAASARSAPRTGNSAPRARTVVRPDASLDAWYLVLDVSPDATRREIQEAMKLRLSRARAARDSDAARRVMRAAASGIAQPRGGAD